MTNWINRIAAAGALLLLNGAVALAQNDMKVDVPFAFQTTNAQLPAGKYFITELPGARVAPFYRIQHGETGKAVVVVASANAVRKSDTRAFPPQVAFKCANDVCALYQIFPVNAERGHQLSVNLKSLPKTAQVATVVISGASE